MKRLFVLLLLLSFNGNIFSQTNQYKDGKKEGIWIEKAGYYDITKINYKNGLKHGVYQNYWDFSNLTKLLENEELEANDTKSGTLKAMGYYVNDVPVGVWVLFWDNGKLRSVTVRTEDGMHNGPYVEFHDNGNWRSKGTLKDGSRDGLFLYYDEEGRLSEKRTYKNGVEITNEKIDLN